MVMEGGQGGEGNLVNREREGHMMDQLGNVYSGRGVFDSLSLPLSFSLYIYRERER